MSEGAASQVAQVKEKNLFWTQRIANLVPNWKEYLKAERQQYRTDVKALLCRNNLADSET